MPTNKRPEGKVLDPKWKVKLVNHGLFKPSWWQRIQLLFGMNVLFTVETFTEQRPGNSACGVYPRLTSFTDTSDQRFITFLKIEQEKGRIQELPAAEQFAEAKRIKEKWEQLVNEEGVKTVPMK